MLLSSAPGTFNSTLQFYLYCICYNQDRCFAETWTWPWQWQENCPFNRKKPWAGGHSWWGHECVCLCFLTFTWVSMSWVYEQSEDMFVKGGVGGWGGFAGLDSVRTRCWLIYYVHTKCVCTNKKVSKSQPSGCNWKQNWDKCWSTWCINLNRFPPPLLKMTFNSQFTFIFTLHTHSTLLYSPLQHRSLKLPPPTVQFVQTSSCTKSSAWPKLFF